MSSEPKSVNKNPREELSLWSQIMWVLRAEKGEFVVFLDMSRYGSAEFASPRNCSDCLGHISNKDNQAKWHL